MNEGVRDRDLRCASRAHVPLAREQLTIDRWNTNVKYVTVAAARFCAFWDLIARLR
jgi:hypothetical protein